MKEKLFRILKATAISMFAFLIFFNISVIVDDNGFAVKMVNSIFAEEWCEDCPENNGTGGGGNTGSGGNNGYWYTGRTDVWHCYSFQTTTVSGSYGGVTVGVGEPCYVESLVSVNTVYCKAGGNECSGTYNNWHWVPNPPCGGSASSNGWITLPC